MKAIKFILAAAIMFVFSNGLTFGQASNNNKETFVDTYPWSGYVPCSDEYVSGTDNVTITFWDGKIQFRGKGEYVGEFGNMYEWSQVENLKFQDWVEGQAYTETIIVRATITRNGEVIAEGKYSLHITVNANGELTSEFERGGYWECVD
jgi:hypothetical protein